MMTQNYNWSRNVTEKVLVALSDTPVILVNGARQTGKSTLVEAIAATRHPAHYVSFDNYNVLLAAKESPLAFVDQAHGEALAIDEVQLFPEVFRAVKIAVDQNRQSGQFILTGSTNVLLLSKASEFLADRMEIMTLWPLSQGELGGVKEGFIDQVFSEGNLNFDEVSHLSLEKLYSVLLTGGYPEVNTRPTLSRQKDWFRSYLTSIMQRDIKELAQIEKAVQFPSIMSLIGTRAGSLLNMSEISRTSGLANTTLKRYLALLEALYLLVRVPAWSRNASKSLVRSPKAYITDTGLYCFLNNLDEQRLEKERGLLGALVENFIAMELMKQQGWSEIRTSLYHYRTRAGQEVDFVLQADNGMLVGIEVKSKAALAHADFKGLRHMQESYGDQFHRGIVLYMGDQTLPFGPNLHAVPMSALWELGARPAYNIFTE
ncbi:MAG: ATP-binding protein [Pseudomonadota bacterium]